MTINTHPAANDILFYDGQCPLCSKEIRWLQKLQRGGLSFQDIHTPVDTALPSSKATMLKTLHLVTKNKEWLLGLDATMKAWSHTPYGFLIKPLRWPVIKYLADKTYHFWALQRYKKKYYCNVCITGSNKD